MKWMNDLSGGSTQYPEARMDWPVGPELAEVAHEVRAVAAEVVAPCAHEVLQQFIGCPECSCPDLAVPGAVNRWRHPHISQSTWLRGR